MVMREISNVDVQYFGMKRRFTRNVNASFEFFDEADGNKWEQVWRKTLRILMLVHLTS